MTGQLLFFVCGRVITSRSWLRRGLPWRCSWRAGWSAVAFRILGIHCFHNDCKQHTRSCRDRVAQLGIQIYVEAIGPWLFGCVTGVGGMRSLYRQRLLRGVLRAMRRRRGTLTRRRVPRGRLCSGGTLVTGLNVGRGCLGGLHSGNCLKCSHRKSGC